MEKVYIKKAFDEFSKHATGDITVTVECNNYSGINLVWNVYGASIKNPKSSFWSLGNSSFEKALEAWLRKEEELYPKVKTSDYQD